MLDTLSGIFGAILLLAVTYTQSADAQQVCYSYDGLGAVDGRYRRERRGAALSSDRQREQLRDFLDCRFKSGD